MKDRYTRVTAPAGFDGQATRRDHYFKTRNAARDFRLRIKRWKAEQKYPADTLSFDDSDKRWLRLLKSACRQPRAFDGNRDSLGTDR
jgi:hypothetical protein